MSCGVGGRHGSDLPLLWLWRRLAATAQIQSLVWELPYAECGPKETKKKRGGGKRRGEERLGLGCLDQHGPKGLSQASFIHLFFIF